MVYKTVKDSSSSDKKDSSIGLETAYRAPMLALEGVDTAIKGGTGSFMKGINDLVVAPSMKHLMGKEPLPYEETFVGKALPTMKQVRSQKEEMFPHLKPKNAIEQMSRNISEDTTSLFLPGRVLRMGRYALTPMRSLGIAASANTFGKGVELWTGDESKGDMAKSGAMLALSLWNPTSARDISANLYQSARQALPQGATVNAAQFANRLMALETRILQGRPAQNVSASERFVLDQIDNFRRLIQNGQMTIEQLVAQRRSFNENLSKNVFDLPDRASKARARELALEISGASRDLMRQYGVQNPEWWRLQSAADTAHSSIQQSNYISRFLEKFMKGRPEGVAHIFGISAPALASHVLGVAAPAAAVAAYQTVKIAHRILRSPELRNHYARVLGAAAAHNVKSTEKELNEFEKASEKKDKKSKSKYKVVD